MDNPSLTVGVEEEFLIVEPTSGKNVPAAREMIDALPEDVHAQSRKEFRRSMIELVSPVCTDVSDLREHLIRLRKATAAVCADNGFTLIATGATPFGEPDLTLPESDRYQAIAAHYGPIAFEPALCGCHVHVGIPDRESGVAVMNWIKPWLPVVSALGVNSPVWNGTEVGYHSWRSIQIQRWPSTGPAPYLDSAADYDELLATLVTSGVLLDEKLVNWHARLSSAYPTIEVRVTDVAATADEAALWAAIIRALVATALTNFGNPARRPRHALVTAAHWRAAKYGVSGTLLDPHTGQLIPAWDLVADLVDVISPALAAGGDSERVTSGLTRIRADGTGAARQLPALHAGPEKLIDLLAKQTIA